MSFGKNLKIERKARHMTQDELAKFIKISRQSVAAYETGKREPNFEILIKIADFFEVTTDYLLGRKGASGSKDASNIIENISRIINNTSLEKFSRDVGNKTGILIPTQKIQKFLSGELIPDNVTLKVFAIYADVDVDYFYKEG